MATLNFTNKKVAENNVWEAIAEVNADFNIHIEVASQGNIEICAGTVNNGKKKIIYSAPEGDVLDQDFHAGVYPKYLRVRCWSQPTMGVITESE